VEVFMRLRCSLAIALLVTIPSAALAAWPESGIVVGDPIYWHFKGSVSLVPDGADGVLVSTSPWHLASRVDPLGGIVWSVDPFSAARLPVPSLGVWISYANSGDDSGGMWFASQDADNTGNVVAVHYDAGGALQPGLATLTEGTDVDRWVRAAIPDGQGGIFVVWSTLVATTNEGEVRAAHVDALGNVTGPANGVRVFDGFEGWSFVGAVADGVGGLLVSRPDLDGAVVQRLDASLEPRYGAGARIEATPVNGGFSLAAAGDGGAFVAWADGPVTAAAMRVQRLGANGLVATGWPTAGTIAARPTRSPGATQVVSDGTGGACLVWLDQHETSGEPVYGVRASRVLANGRIAHGWQPAGVEVAAGGYPSLDSRSVLVADGTGGCYLAWAFPSVMYGDVFAQHLVADGSVFPGWPAGGLPLGSHSFGNYYDSPYAIPDGSGGVYVGWDEISYPMNYHQAHVTRLSPGGPAGDGRPLTPSLSLARVAPNPASGVFTVSATMPDDRTARLEVFDLAGRVSESREVHGAGERGLTLDASRLAPGVHWLRLTHPTGIRTARIIVVR
jgi:hypothetical protein